MGRNGSGALRWRILRDPPGAAAWNMAVDEALARTAQEGEGTLRIYRWRRPTLSFGRNQPARDRYEVGSAEALDVEVVRRPTGGREVLHDRELTYSVTAPLEALGGLRSAYRFLNEALIAALRSLGVAARLASPDGRAPAPDAGACFHAPAEGEVEVGGRKLVGSAQVRVGRRLLQHGSLLLASPTVELGALAPTGPGRPAVTAPGFTTLEEALGAPPPFSRVADEVEGAMARSLGGCWEPGTLRPDEEEVAWKLHGQYESYSWTWRR